MSNPHHLLLAENRALLESRRLVVERLVGVPMEVDRPASESAASGDGLLFAIVGEADRGNANKRVYPATQWTRNIGRVNADPAGRLLGAVDHPGPLDGGTLKSSPIIWRNLELLADGRVRGEFVLLEDHTSGRDLRAIITAGGKVGFSTYGYASAHEPSAAERERYKLPPINQDDADDLSWAGWIVIDDWELIKIDAVDNPSVAGAWLQRPTKEESMTIIAKREDGGSGFCLQMASVPCVGDLLPVGNSESRVRVVSVDHLDAGEARVTVTASIAHPLQEFSDTLLEPVDPVDHFGGGSLNDFYPD
ncbi:MAG TPA: hypothetical protein VGB55_06570 [Tepidisphaeraceae bacterium]|jgi:hypothetical protein